MIIDLLKKILFKQKSALYTLGVASSCSCSCVYGPIDNCCVVASDHDMDYVSLCYRYSEQYDIEMGEDDYISEKYQCKQKKYVKRMDEFKARMEPASECCAKLAGNESSYNDKKLREYCMVDHMNPDGAQCNADHYLAMRDAANECCPEDGVVGCIDSFLKADGKECKPEWKALPTLQQ